MYIDIFVGRDVYNKRFHSNIFLMIDCIAEEEKIVLSRVEVAEELSQEIS